MKKKSQWRFTKSRQTISEWQLPKVRWHSAWKPKLCWKFTIAIESVGIKKFSFDGEFISVALAQLSEALCLPTQIYFFLLHTWSGYITVEVLHSNWAPTISKCSRILLIKLFGNSIDISVHFNSSFVSSRRVDIQQILFHFRLFRDYSISPTLSLFCLIRLRFRSEYETWRALIKY